MAKKEFKESSFSGEHYQKEPTPTVPIIDALIVQYEETLAEATKQFEFVSQTGDKALISKAAQKIADIKQQELDRIANISGYSESKVG